MPEYSDTYSGMNRYHHAAASSTMAARLHEAALQAAAFTRWRARRAGFQLALHLFHNNRIHASEHAPWTCSKPAATPRG